MRTQERSKAIQYAEPPGTEFQEQGFESVEETCRHTARAAQHILLYKRNNPQSSKIPYCARSSHRASIPQRRWRTAMCGKARHDERHPSGAPLWFLHVNLTGHRHYRFRSLGHRVTIEASEPSSQGRVKWRGTSESDIDL